MMRTLIVYYSLSGNTARLAHAIAAALNADVERIAEVAPRKGVSGGLRGVYEVLFGVLPEIKPPTKSPADYDLVIIGGPVWAGGAATPLRTYLQAYIGGISRVAYFVTAGGDYEGALKHMETLVGRSPDATLGVSGEELRSERWRDKLDAFITALRAAAAA